MKLWHSIQFWRWTAISLLTLLCAITTAAAVVFPWIAGARYWLLDRAACSGDETSVRMLLSIGASPDGTKDYPYYLRHFTPLEFSSHLSQAAYSGNLAVVKQLLDAGANPNVVEGSGRTAIMSAAERGHTDIARLLMESGADPLADHGEGSALSIARSKGQMDTVEAILVQAEAGKTQPLSPEIQSTVLKESSNRIGISFPKGTRVLGCELTTEADDITHLKIQIPSRSLQSFLGNFRDTDFSPGLSALPTKLPNQPWWRPAEIAEPMEAEATLAPGEHVKLLCSKYPDEWAEIYVVWFRDNGPASRKSGN